MLPGCKLKTETFVPSRSLKRTIAGVDQSSTGACIVRTKHCSSSSSECAQRVKRLSSQHIRNRYIDSLTKLRIEEVRRGRLLKTYFGTKQWTRDGTQATGCALQVSHAKYRFALGQLFGKQHIGQFRLGVGRHAAIAAALVVQVLKSHVAPLEVVPFAAHDYNSHRCTLHTETHMCLLS